jgi:hypothetical protein
MAGITINQLPSASSLLPSDILLASSGSVTSQVTVANLRGSMISGSDFVPSYEGLIQATNLAMFSGSTSLTASKVIQSISLEEEFISSRYIITASVNLGSLNSTNNFYGTISHYGPVTVSGSITSSGNIYTPGLCEFGTIGSQTNLFMSSRPVNITTGYNNTSIGKYSVYYVITGSNNTGIGTFSCQYTNGSGNTAVGALTLISTNSNTQVNMDYNTAIGMYSLRDTTTGSFNTSIGAYSLNKNIDGNNNIAIGYYSGVYTNTTNENATSITGSILIGGGSRPGGATSSNQILITYYFNSYGIATGGDNTILIPKSTNLFGMVGVEKLIIKSFEIVLPTTPTDPGTTGTVLVGSNYIYVCVAPNSWKRTALGSTF